MRIAWAGSIAVIVVLALYFAIRFASRPRSEDADIVITDEKGRQMTPDDLANFTGTLNWSIEDKKDIPEKAQNLLNLGREAGAAGNYDEAVRVLEQAAAAAPGWAYPIYEAAYTHLLMGDLEKAERDYLRVEKLEPRGFFTYQSELDCVRRERAGEFKTGTCQSYVLLSDMPRSAEKQSALKKLLDSSPSLAPAWEKLAGLCDSDQEAMEAIDRGLASRPDPQTRGSLLLNKALILNRQGQYKETIALLEDLVSAPDSSLDTVAKAKYTIGNISSHRK
jgi:tetratricopeptide (TPR) repeat protein